MNQHNPFTDLFGTGLHTRVDLAVDTGPVGVEDRQHDLIRVAVVYVIECEGQVKQACVAETVALIYA